jgi:CspA family cold shock protein
MVRGIVKWFDNKKGYGFITKEDGSGDVFVYYANIEFEGYKTLNEGDNVEFNIVDGPKGPKAENVRKI